MALPLSPQDITRLLSNPSTALRADIAAKVTATLSGSGLVPKEITLAQDIVRILARDIETSVRASIAQGLRHSPHLPHDVALKLAADIDAVAFPLLADSFVLTDDDLIEIIQQGSAHKQETIASRANLPATVSGALITHAQEPAVVALMANKTATIDDDSLNFAVTRFAGSEPVKRAMVTRHTLPITVSERLVTMVSRELQEHLVKVHALSPSAAADIVMASRETEVIHLSMGSTEEELQRMVAQMQHNGRLTPSLILRALCTGDIAFFEAAMAVKGDVPIVNAQVLIHEPSRRGLAALFRKAKLPASLFDAVRAAVDVVDETGFDGNDRDLERFRARVISRVLTLVDTVDAADADYLIQKLGDVLMQPANGSAKDPATQLGDPVA